MDGGENKGNGARMKEISGSTDPGFLLDVFRCGDEYECSSAVDAFTRLPINKYDSLVPATKNADYRIRKWAALALGRCDGDFFAPQIIDMLKDRSSQVRHAAFCALYDLLNEKVACQLDDAVKNSKSKHMIELGNHLLEEVEKKGIRKNGKPALNELQILMAKNAGLSKQDLDELRKKGFTKPIFSKTALFETAAQKKAFVH